jgi:hypothetical protein
MRKAILVPENDVVHRAHAEIREKLRTESDGQALRLVRNERATSDWSTRWNRPYANGGGKAWVRVPSLPLSRRKSRSLRSHDDFRRFVASIRAVADAGAHVARGGGRSRGRTGDLPRVAHSCELPPPQGPSVRDVLTVDRRRGPQRRRSRVRPIQAERLGRARGRRDRLRSWRRCLCGCRGAS